MINNTLSPSKNTTLLIQTGIIFTLVLGVFSLLHNVSFYMSQYFVVSMTEMDSGRMALGSSVLLSLLGYHLSFSWGKAQVIKIGALLSAVGLLSAAVVSQPGPFIASVVLFGSGLAFSVPGLFLSVKETCLAKKSYVTVFYSAMVVLLAIIVSWVLVVNSYYGFKELCCALAVLLMATGIGITSARLLPTIA